MDGTDSTLYVARVYIARHASVRGLDYDNRQSGTTPYDISVLSACNGTAHRTVVLLCTVTAVQLGGLAVHAGRGCLRYPGQ